MPEGGRSVAQQAVRAARSAQTRARTAAFERTIRRHSSPPARRRRCRRMPSRSNSRWSCVASGIRRGQQPVAEEHRVGAGQEAERLRLVGQRQPAGAQPDERRRHQDARGGDRPHQLERILGRQIGQRRAVDADQQVHRHALGMRIERRPAAAAGR